MKPVRIRLSRAKGWRLPPGAVVVARPTPWGNPFRVGPRRPAARVVELYRLMLAGYFELTTDPDFARQALAQRHAFGHIDELRGRDLACWCALDAPCHADVLLEIANRYQEWRPGRVAQGEPM